MSRRRKELSEHSYKSTHHHGKPTATYNTHPASLAALTRIEAAHQEGLVFATILSSCMCERQARRCSFTLILVTESFTQSQVESWISEIRETSAHSYTNSVTLSLCSCWFWQCFPIFALWRARRRVPTGGTKVLWSHSAQCWWQGYGCYRGWVVLAANNTADASWLLYWGNRQQTLFCSVHRGIMH